MDAEQLTAQIATQAATVTQLSQLMTQLVATLTAVESGRRGGDADAVASGTTASKGTKSHKKVFEQKSFSTLDKFGEGNAEQFQDWSYQVKMLTKGESE
jgi:ADP-ribosylglycohydrolase